MIKIVAGIIVLLVLVCAAAFYFAAPEPTVPPDKEWARKACLQGAFAQYSEPHYRAEVEIDPSGIRQAPHGWKMTVNYAVVTIVTDPRRVHFSGACQVNRGVWDGDSYNLQKPDLMLKAPDGYQWHIMIDEALDNRWYDPR
jgi:hypothetical protein